MFEMHTESIFGSFFWANPKCGLLFRVSSSEEVSITDLCSINHCFLQKHLLGASPLSGVNKVWIEKAFHRFQVR